MTDRPAWHDPATITLLTRLRRLLDETLDLGPVELEAFLRGLAGEQPEDARELAALLAAEPALDAAHFLLREVGSPRPF